MKKLIACLLLLATMLALFVSCGNADGSIGKDPLPFNDVYRSDFKMPDSGIYKNATTVSFPSGTYSTSVYYNDGSYFVYHANGNYCIYNVDLNRTVLEFSSYSVSSSDIECRDDFIRVYENNTTKVYLSDGTFVAQASGRQYVSAPYYDMQTGRFVFADKLYIVKNGKISETVDLPPLVDASDCMVTDNYIVLFTDNNYGVVYYDKSFNKVASYAIPGTAYDYDTYFLGDKLLVQYVLECKSDAWTYTYIEDGTKYLVEHVLFDPATSKAKALGYNILIDEVANRDLLESNEETNCFTDKVENIIVYRAFIDHRIDSSAQHAVLVDNEGKIGAAIDRYVEGQKSITFPVNDKYYAAMTDSGYTLLDKNGNVVSELPTMDSIKEYGILSGNKIYGFDLKLKLDLSGEDYTILSASNDHALIYSKTVGSSTRYYRYDATGEKEIYAPSGNVNYVSTNSYFYYVAYAYYDTNTYANRYAYYSFDGKFLFSTSDSYISTYAQSDNAVLVSYEDIFSGTNVYIRVSK